MGRDSGFTLLELIIVIALAGVFVTMAVVSYRTSIDSSNVSAEVDSLSTDLAYARSEAVRQGLNVVVCSTTDGATCNNASSWASGWLVMLPTGGGCTVSSGLTAATILRRAPALTSLDSISFTYATGNSTSNAICYSRLGTANLGGSNNVAKFSVIATAGVSSPSQFNKQCIFVVNAGPLHVVRYGVTDSIGSC